MEVISRKRLQVCSALALGCLVSVGQAFEPPTHEVLTKEAFDQSVLSEPNKSPLFAFGLSDLMNPILVTRPVTIFESVQRTHARRIMEIGANYEDELFPAELRVLNHFFDPQHGGIPLTVAGLALGNPSPNWVLEDEGRIADQEYSIRVGLEHHYKALTFPYEPERMQHLGALLEILGRSVHHLQDMAQPAHTRNDDHLPIEGDIYESFTNSWFTTRPIPSASPYDTPGVDLRMFNTARKFWINDGKGIAEFSSRNFVSRDTNFEPLDDGSYGRSTTHALPVPVGKSQYTYGAGTMTFIHSQVEDRYSGKTFINDRASTHSFFDVHLIQRRVKQMSLNRLNFERTYEILLPRAIAYSAGFINYHFRGRIQVDRIELSGGTLVVTLRNRSAAEFPMKRGGQGLGLRLYYDRRDGRRAEIPLLNQIDLSDWRYDETRDIVFVRPSDVDPGKDKPYLLVFDGTIGNEYGIAAETFGSAQGALLVRPSNYSPTDRDTGTYSFTYRGGSWEIEEEADATAGTIDWKGHRPEDVLTYGNRRYRYTLPGGNAVYKNGRVLTRGPKSGMGVVGASVRYANGVRLLNYAAFDGGSVHFYSRLFADQYENEEPWSEANPLGWRLLSTLPFHLFTGVFFNASGTEAQFITHGWDGPDKRVKVTIQGDEVHHTIYPAIATVSRTWRSHSETNPKIEIHAGVCDSGYSENHGILPDTSACGKREFSGSFSTAGFDNRLQTYQERTLLCVDYRGDQEVFCEVLPPEDPNLVTQNLLSHVEQNYASNTRCPGPTIDERKRMHMDTYSSGNADERILKIGDAEVPLPMRRFGYVTKVESVGTSSPAPTSGTGNHLFDSAQRKTRVLLADARYDFVVFDSELSTIKSSSAGAYTEETEGFPDILDSIIEERRELVALHRGKRHELFVDEPPAIRSTRSGDFGVEWKLIPREIRRCDAVPSSRGHSETETFTDPVAAKFELQDFGVAYAIDFEGRLALSVGVTAEVDVDTIQSYRNLLSDGDLAVLIPGDWPDEGPAFDIRLLR